jgi:hypothetical protein
VQYTCDATHVAWVSVRVNTLYSSGGRLTLQDNGTLGRLCSVDGRTYVPNRLHGLAVRQTVPRFTPMPKALHTYVYGANHWTEVVQIEKETDHSVHKAPGINTAQAALSSCHWALDTADMKDAVFPLLHPDVTSLHGGVAADSALLGNRLHAFRWNTVSIFKGQEAARGNVSLKCDRFKTARQGWRANHGGVAFSCNS